MVKKKSLLYFEYNVLSFMLISYMSKTFFKMSWELNIKYFNKKNYFKIFKN